MKTLVSKNAIGPLFAVVLLALVVPTFFSSCEAPPSEYLKNERPVTRLSNIPPLTDTITAKNPRMALNWVGDDPDGYIVGFKYRWSSYKVETNGSTAAAPYQVRPWSTVLNILIGNMALMLDSTYQPSEKYAFKVYHYFATLPPEGLDDERLEALAAGDTILIEGVPIFASNPDAVRYPVHVNPNGGTFIFDAQELKNLQTFEVYAIDNSETIGEAAKVSFVTPYVEAPVVEISVFPREADTSYVLSEFTETFPGLYFEFEGTDPNSRTIEYSWTVDSVRWSPWSANNFAYVNASDFRIDTATTHLFSVRARNEFGAINPRDYHIRIFQDSAGNTASIETVWQKQTFHTVLPYFKRPGYIPKMLVIINAYQWAPDSVSPWRPSLDMIESYYRAVLDSAGMTGRYEVVRVQEHGFPGKASISRFGTVLLVADAVNEVGKYFSESPDPLNDFQPYLTGKKYNTLEAYCYIGGKMIISSRNLGTIANAANYMFTRLIHAEALTGFGGIGCPPFAAGEAEDLIGATGLALFPNVTIDPSKVDPSGAGGIAFTNLVVPTGFGERIYNYKGTGASEASQCYEGRSIGIRYDGITFNVVYFGFPLYHVQQSDAVTAMRKTLTDMGAFK